MRVISGKLKGKTISFLKSKKTRPLKDSVKENIFNVLAHSNLVKVKLEMSNILDLYSGIGSFGIECISRGANRITFVEKDKDVVQTLKKNLSNLSIQNQATIETDEIKNFLNKKQDFKFEIIFLDPPFIEETYINELRLIHKKKIYTKNHLVILHREKSSPNNFEQIINPLIIKEYGRSKIVFGRF